MKMDKVVMLMLISDRLVISVIIVSKVLVIWMLIMCRLEFSDLICISWVLRRLVIYNVKIMVRKMVIMLCEIIYKLKCCLLMVNLICFMVLIMDGVRLVM